jgi:hypothetical protein
LALGGDAAVVAQLVAWLGEIPGDVLDGDSDAEGKVRPTSCVASCGVVIAAIGG